MKKIQCDGEGPHSETDCELSVPHDHCWNETEIMVDGEPRLVGGCWEPILSVEERARGWCKMCENERVGISNYKVFVPVRESRDRTRTPYSVRE